MHQNVRGSEGDSPVNHLTTCFPLNSGPKKRGGRVSAAAAARFCVCVVFASLQRQRGPLSPDPVPPGPAREPGAGGPSSLLPDHDASVREARGVHPSRDGRGSPASPSPPRGCTKRCASGRPWAMALPRLAGPGAHRREPLVVGVLCSCLDAELSLTSVFWKSLRAVVRALMRHTFVGHVLGVGRLMTAMVQSGVRPCASQPSELMVCRWRWILNQLTDNKPGHT